MTARKTAAAVVVGVAIAAVGGVFGGLALTEGPTTKCTQGQTAAQCQLHGPPGTHALGTLLGKTVARGIDFGWGGPSVATMKANGWSFAFSYLSYDFSKNWHVQQALE